MVLLVALSDQRPGKLHVRPPDPTLVSLMTKGKAWLQQFTQGGQAIETIAEREKLSSRYVNRVINVALLAPDIVQAIERGGVPSFSVQ